MFADKQSSDFQDKLQTINKYDFHDPVCKGITEINWCQIVLESNFKSLVNLP